MTVKRSGGVARFLDKDGKVYLRGRIRLADGSRERIDLPEELTHEKAAAAARAWVAAVQKGEDRDGKFLLAKLTRKAEKNGLPPPHGETVAAYFSRRCASRHIKSLKDERGRMNKWVLPQIGNLAIATVTPRDLQILVAKLDDAAREGIISGKTAKNVWGHVTKMFMDACKSKLVELRVRDDNPCALVEGPNPGHLKDEPFLTPAELLALLNSERTPVRWARIFAITTYLMLRRGELEALDCSDIHVEDGYVLVHRAVDREGKTGLTKTGKTRPVGIEPTLVPLLQVMMSDAQSEGILLTMPPSESLATTLRRYLEWAGVTREALFVPSNDPTRRRLVFHSLRDTGITWRAVRGDDPLKIQRAAGHDDLDTTQGYIHAAEVFGRGFGDVFPPLPKRLMHPLFPLQRATNGPTQNRRPPARLESEADMSVPSGSRTLLVPENIDESVPYPSSNAKSDPRVTEASEGLGPPSGQTMAACSGLAKVSMGLAMLQLSDPDEYALKLAGGETVEETKPPR